MSALDVNFYLNSPFYTQITQKRAKVLQHHIVMMCNHIKMM